MNRIIDLLVGPVRRPVLQNLFMFSQILLVSEKSYFKQKIKTNILHPWKFILLPKPQITGYEPAGSIVCILKVAIDCIFKWIISRPVSVDLKQQRDAVYLIVFKLHMT